MQKPRIHTEHEVRAAVEGARSLSEALRAMGLRAAGGNFRMLKRLIEYYDISVDHMDPNWFKRGNPRRQARVPLEQVLVEHSTYKRASLKSRLFEEGLKTRVCELCGQGEMWNGVKISLILDHVNGVFDDNRLENLRIVCPNCNAGLDTHCGRHNRNGPRECLLCGTQFQPKYTGQQYCSHKCGTSHPGRHAPRPQTRKVERPSYEQLLRELEASNYSAVARKHGVSDNAVRKWLRAYEYQRQNGTSP